MQSKLILFPEYLNLLVWYFLDFSSMDIEDLSLINDALFLLFNFDILDKLGGLIFFVKYFATLF